MGAGIQTPPPACEEEKEGCTLNIPKAPGGAALIPTESYKAFCPPPLPPAPPTMPSAQWEFSKHWLELGNGAESIILSNCLVGMAWRGGRCWRLELKT